MQPRNRLRFSDIYQFYTRRVVGLHNLINSKSKESVRILEVGCGSAEMTFFLYQAGYNAHGIDLEFKPDGKVELLRKKGRIRKIGPSNLIRANLGSLADTYSFPHDDGTFDITFSESTVEHVENLDRFVEENARVLVEGGFSIHYFPSKFSLIEPHIGIPLGGIIRNAIYYQLMIKLGLCFERYRTKTGHEECLAFIKEATFYRSRKQYIQSFRRHGLELIEDNALGVLFSKKSQGDTIAKIILFVPLLPTWFKYLRSNVYIFKKNIGNKK